MSPLRFWRDCLDRCLLTAIAAALCLSVAGCQSSGEPPDDDADHHTTHPAYQQQAADEYHYPDSSPAPPDQQHDEIAERISNEDLSMFAMGVRAVAEREDELERQGRDLETLESEARSPIDVRQAQQEVREEMEDALAEVGLRFDDFMTIAQIIRQSPELMDRLGDHLDDDEIEDFYGVE